MLFVYFPVPSPLSLLEPAKWSYPGTWKWTSSSVSFLQGIQLHILWLQGEFSGEPISLMVLGDFSLFQGHWFGSDSSVPAQKLFQTCRRDLDSFIFLAVYNLLQTSHYHTNHINIVATDSISVYI